jgi:Na+-transporting NADH:ubiquinone oxidoreductase subunit NqrE
LELLIASAAYRAVPLRDITGVTRLDRGAWLQLGLFLGLMAVGVTIAVSPRVMKLRADPSPDTLLPAVGAGMAITLHGLALATLQLLLIADISR